MRTFGLDSCRPAFVVMEKGTPEQSLYKLVGYGTTNWLRHQSLWKPFQSTYGFGLLVKETIRLQSNSELPGLKGQLIRVDLATFNRLQQRGYRSLVSFGKRRGVLIGPVSLLNHSCKETLFLNRNFRVVLKSSLRVRRKLAAGVQLFVNYGSCFGQSCIRCPVK